MLGSCLWLKAGCDWQIGRLFAASAVMRTLHFFVEDRMPPIGGVLGMSNWEQNLQAQNFTGGIIYLIILGGNWEILLEGKNKKADGGVFTSQITVILITNINKNDIHYFFNSLNVHNKQKMWKERRWRKSEIQWIRTCWRLFNQQLHWSCWQEENESLQKEHKYTVNFSTLTWT